MVLPVDIDRLSAADLKSLVLKLLEEVSGLRRTVAAQRDEIARLKGGPGRPNIKPSGMDKGTDPEPAPTTGGAARPKGSKTSKLSIHEERTVRVTAPPRGSRFKGYRNFVVQDLRIRPHVVNFRRERWQGPDGATLTAPLPDGISGHFGPELRRFVLAQYHQGQVTMPRLWALLRAFGILISKRQLVRLLIAGQDGFHDEARDVLRAGLISSAWITVDDTGARHKAANGFCTQIGNAHFTWFGTTPSKSRSNFLELLRAGHGDYVINAEALAYMRQRALAGPVIARLAEHRRKSFADQAAWTAHLDRLGISTVCSHGSMPTKANCSWCSIGPRFRSTPTDRRTTFAAKSPSERSAQEHEATPAATVATLSSASARPAQSSASHSGTISVHGSTCQTTRISHTCHSLSGTAARPPDGHQLCPYYQIPYATEQGIFECLAGNFFAGAGNLQGICREFC